MLHLRVSDTHPCFRLFVQQRCRIPGGGVTSIYTGTGRAIFWGAFFRAGNKFWGIIFGKIIGGHKFWGIIFSITNYGPIIRYLFPT